MLTSGLVVVIIGQDDSSRVTNCFHDLVEYPLTEPVVGIASHPVLSGLIVAEEEYGERQCSNPIHEGDVFGVECVLNEWYIHQNKDERNLLNDTAVEHHVRHSMIEQRLDSCLARQTAADLAHDNTGKESCLGLS